MCVGNSSVCQTYSCFVNRMLSFVCCSTKSCTQLLKDEGKSPILDPSTRVGISKNISNLISKGINGSIKKESVVSTLEELAVC